MSPTQRNRFGIRATTLLALASPAFALLAGCLGLRLDKAPLEPVPLPQAALEQFLATGHDARRANITIYRGATGKPTFQFANRPWDSKVARIQFLGPKASRLPVLRAQTARMVDYGLLLDPTARQNWCLLSVADDFDFSPFREAPSNDPVGEYPDHVESPVPGYAGVANKIVLETLHVESPVFYVPAASGLLGALARPQAAPAPERTASQRRALDRTRKQAVAVMGAALMRAFAFIRVDFINREALFSTIATKPYVPLAYSVATAELHSWRERPTVRVTLDGTPVDCLIDLVGDFALSVPASSFADGLVPETVSLAFGDYVLDGVPVVTHEALGLPETTPPRIGWRLWREYAVSLDFKSDTLWLEDPAHSHETAKETSPDAAGDAEPSAAPIHYPGIAP